jgi:hypothetical protein
MQSDAATAAGLDRVLEPLGMNLAGLRNAAEEIVLFGSRAAGVSDDLSDWDVLCVGYGRSIRAGGADLVWVRPDVLGSDLWLGSELASHIAEYGHWLAGSGAWRGRARISRRALDAKLSAIQMMLAELDRLWIHLLPPARVRHAMRVRRDIQRLQVLCEGRAVPPRPYLDELWAGSNAAEEDLPALRRSLRAVVARLR